MNQNGLLHTMTLSKIDLGLIRSKMKVSGLENMPVTIGLFMQLLH